MGACLYVWICKCTANVCVSACVCLFVHVRAWVKAGERLSTNRIDGFFRQACSHAFMHVYVCVIEQVDRCEGWLLAQRSVGRSMQSKLKPVGTASSMESAPTYTRYNTYVLYNLIMVLDLDVCCVLCCNVKKTYISDLSSSFMRNAQLLSGNVMKIFRFRDRLAGGALYSGR